MHAQIIKTVPCRLHDFWFLMAQVVTLHVWAMCLTALSWNTATCSGPDAFLTLMLEPMTRRA